MSSLQHKAALIQLEIAEKNLLRRHSELAALEKCLETYPNRTVPILLQSTHSIPLVELGAVLAGALVLIDRIKYAKIILEQAEQLVDARRLIIKLVDTHPTSSE